ncbi:MAG: hypothetical protein ABIJ18_01305 [archaeon]
MEFTPEDLINGILSGIETLLESLPETFLNFILDLLNQPLQSYLNNIQLFLSTAPMIELFSTLWAIIIYIISMSYGLLFVYSGLKIMISGYSATKRAEAKSTLQNTLIMVIVIQSSYYLYSLIISVNNALTSSIYNLIDPSVFVLQIGNFLNVGDAFIGTLVYINVLLITQSLVVIRYMIVSFGVVLFPIGLFLYFLIPLRQYGKAILNFLLLSVFSSFFCALIILMGSLIFSQNIFGATNFLGISATFLCVDLLLVYLLFSSLFSLISFKRTIKVVTKVVSGVPPSVGDFKK